MSGLRLTYVGHATVLIEAGGCRILTDPLLGARFGPVVRVAAAVDPAVTEGLDAVLVSHPHADHLDVPSLLRLPPTVDLIVPRGAGRFLRRLGPRSIHELRVDEQIDVGPLRVRAVPAEHDGHRWPHGPRSETVGFLLTGPARVYFAGDTELFDEMTDLDEGLDLALVPIWGWGPRVGEGHLRPREAAEALALLRPRVAVPIHWGTIYPAGLRWVHPGPLADPPIDFVREAARRAPGVEVRVVRPGGTLELEVGS